MQAVGSNQASPVAQLLGHLQGQGPITEQFAGIVVDRAGDHSERLGAGYLATAVIHAAEVLQRQLTGRVDQSVLVIQVPLVKVQTQAGVAVKVPLALLVQAADRCVQRLSTGNRAALTVFNRPGRQIKCLLAGERTALLVIQLTYLHSQCSDGLDASLMVVGQSTRHLQPQRSLTAQQPFLAVVQ
ncbi:hypothetical protein D3C78_1119810 [compost metagenome]